jgi:hypothetical protein
MRDRMCEKCAELNKPPEADGRAAEPGSVDHISIDMERRRRWSHYRIVTEW